MDYRAEYETWCEDAYFDEQTKAELRALAGNEAEIRDRFCRRLEFGTGGLRGVIGAGTNRMNRYTVRQATQGLANYILQQGGRQRGVAIAYDSRNFSPEFAGEAALCLNANGIPAYVFESLRPTPELSFAVRELGCIAGIVITASHNPREYNGYKVYWEDGAQITPPHDRRILEEVAKITDFAAVRTMEKEKSVRQGLYRIIGKEIDDAYLEQVRAQSVHPEIVEQMAKELKIVYTPLHGAGNLPVRRVLHELGFRQVYVVKEQEAPDGDFPTVPYPNPEEEGAWELALKLAREVDADIVLATDPDADRLGVWARDKASGRYIRFTGNMSGMLIAEYLLRERRKTGTMPEHPVLVKTIVTTNMAGDVAKHYGAELVEVLTGFKYIGEQIKRMEEQKSRQFLFGLEESYGCLAGTYARDKDACVAVMLLCEVAAWCKARQQTLWDAMLEMYERYGYYKEGLFTLSLKGEEGARRIQSIMREFRENRPDEVGGLRVLGVRDYANGIYRRSGDGKTRPLELPRSNVLYYELEEGAWFCVRPSGTEPKLKYYYGVKGSSLEDAAGKLEEIKTELIRRGGLHG